MNMSKLCPKCQYFVGAPLLSSTVLIHLGMDFSRAAHVVAGILFHSSIMTSRSCWMLRRMVLLHLPLDDAPHVLNRVQVWRHTSPSITFTFSSISAVCLGWLCWKTVSERRAFIICFRMPQYMLESMFPQ